MRGRELALYPVYMRVEPEVAKSDPGKQPSQEPEHSRYEKCIASKSPSLWYFVIATDRTKTFLHNIAFRKSVFIWNFYKLQIR